MAILSDGLGQSPEPALTCGLFARLAEQLTPDQRGELEVIRHEVIRLRAWGRAQAAAERERWAAADELAELRDAYALLLERLTRPTAAMELAGMRALRNTYRTVSGQYSREQARACWDAMVTALRA